MLSTLKAFIVTYYKELNLPKSLLDEFLTFYEESFHDDEVMAYALAIVAHQLLDKYRNFLMEHKNFNNKVVNTDLDDMPMLYSSVYNLPVTEHEKESKKVNISKVPEVNVSMLELLKSEIGVNEKSNRANSNDDNTGVIRARFLSIVHESSSIDDDTLVF